MLVHMGPLLSKEEFRVFVEKIAYAQNDQAKTVSHKRGWLVTGVTN